MEHPRHIVVVGCLIENSRKDILLIRHRKRGWELPQGRVEEGEGLIDALHREVMEETGVEVKLGPLAAVWSKTSPPTALIFNFMATYGGGQPTPSDETPEVGWFSRQEALGMITHPVNLDRFRTLLDFSGRTLYLSYTSSPYQVLARSCPGAP